MSVDELMDLLEGHPGATQVMAVYEPPATAIFISVAIQASPGPAPIALLLVLGQVPGAPQRRQATGAL